MLAVKSGTTSYRTITSAGQLVAGEIAYNSEFVWDADGTTPLMVWDAGIGNVRPMTSAEIAALPGQRATAAAQAAKATATAGIDNGQLQVGDKEERLVRALALVVLDEINLIRANFTPAMTARTTTQVVNAIKAKIAATAE